MKHKVRVLVVDDSAFNRRTLVRMLVSHPALDVVDTAYDGHHAIRKVLIHDPDVITLDLEMPNMDGFAFLRWLMASCPKPVIVVSAYPESSNVFRALEMGALDFVAKPGGPVSPRLAEIRDELVEKILAAVQSHVQPRVFPTAPSLLTPVLEAPTTPRGFLLIGASTGGPSSIRWLLQQLPVLPIAILIAQHMPPGFTRLFAERLRTHTFYRVKEAEHYEKVRAATVYIAPGGYHMELMRARNRFILRVVPRQPHERFVPSIDRLFQSAAQIVGPQSLGVVLTGMGDDGVKGARVLKESRATIYVEHPETAIASSMPSSVLQGVSVDATLPLEALPEAICRWFQKGS